jgi:segregation and condensation protein B
MDNPNLDKNANLDNITLALLFAADEPLSVRRIASILEHVEAADIRRSIEAWRRRFDDEAWSIALEQVAGGYQLVTRPDYGAFVGRLYSKRRKLRLSRAGMESLAIIAYKQPVTRADIETVRGVACGGVIANLMERSLIKITGKARVLGAPFLYGTTSEFLEYLGLNSLKDLPSMEELEALLEREAYPDTAVGVEGAVGFAGDDDSDDGGESDDLESIEGAVAEAMGAARLGPVIDEPQNRPVDQSPAQGAEAAEKDETPNTQQATIDGREDDR